MKYFLSILCLFILSCDSANDDADVIFMLGENFTMSMNQNTIWSYEFISGIYSENNNEVENYFWVEGQIDRRVVNIIDTEIENDTDCGFVIENTISTDLIDLPEFDYGNDFLIELQYDNIINWYNDIYYSFYSNDQESFYSCGTYSEDVVPNDDEIVSHVSKSPEPINIFNIIRLDYPLYLGKTWERVIADSFDEPILSFEYEIVSQENIILDINGTLTLFECYKITMSMGDNPFIEFYISNEGIIKIEHSGEFEVTTQNNPEGSEFDSMHIIHEIILTDF